MNEEHRCPDEQNTISDAICRRRQEKMYPKCGECPHKGPVRQHPSIAAHYADKLRVKSGLAA